MLVALWSPKGGSGTSTLAAALSLRLARRGGARLADLAGDQPAIFGIEREIAAGLGDWLSAGPGAVAEALDRLSVEAAPDLVMLPLGDVSPAAAPAEAGTALGLALREHPVATVADLGRADTPALAAVSEAADLLVVVVRPCYLALRRGVNLEATRRSTGCVVVDEPRRSLGARDVAEVLSLPVLARVPVHPAISRVVDAGVLPSRVPEPLARAADAMLDRLGAANLVPREAA